MFYKKCKKEKNNYVQNLRGKKTILFITVLQSYNIKQTKNLKKKSNKHFLLFSKIIQKGKNAESEIVMFCCKGKGKERKQHFSINFLKKNIKKNRKRRKEECNKKY